GPPASRHATGAAPRGRGASGARSPSPTGAPGDRARAVALLRRPGRDPGHRAGAQRGPARARDAQRGPADHPRPGGRAGDRLARAARARRPYL
ncbi:MAG: hypothetical protein AVDCRST_MAG38-645, partial [uncultured Solirubrobacteraceae bacterium]